MKQLSGIRKICNKLVKDMLERIKNSKLGKKIKKSKFLKNIYILLFINSKKARIKRSFKKNSREVIELLVKTLNETNYTYFAAFGTLLGFVRENKNIDYDLDFDFGIINNSSFNFDEFIKFMKKNDFNLHHWYEHQGVIHEFTLYNKLDKNIHIDFFIFDINSKKERLEKYAYYLEEDGYEAYVEYLPIIKNVIYKNVYNGICVPIPENYEEFLEAAYTKNWRIPDPNWSSFSKPNQYKLENIYGIKKTPSKKEYHGKI